MNWFNKLFTKSPKLFTLADIAKAHNAPIGSVFEIDIGHTKISQVYDGKGLLHGPCGYFTDKLTSLSSPYRHEEPLDPAKVTYITDGAARNAEMLIILRVLSPLMGFYLWNETSPFTTVAGGIHFRKDSADNLKEECWFNQGHNPVRVPASMYYKLWDLESGMIEQALRNLYEQVIDGDTFTLASKMAPLKDLPKWLRIGPGREGSWYDQAIGVQIRGPVTEGTPVITVHQYQVWLDGAGLLKNPADCVDCTQIADLLINFLAPKSAEGSVIRVMSDRFILFDKGYVEMTLCNVSPRGRINHLLNHVNNEYQVVPKKVEAE